MSLNIVGGQMPATGQNTEALGWFRVTFAEFEAVQFSVDGGTTWDTTAPLAGGTLVATTGQLPGFMSVSVTPTEAGSFDFLMRLDGGASQFGDPFVATLTVLETEVDGFFQLFAPQTQLLSNPVATENGFVMSVLSGNNPSPFPDIGDADIPGAQYLAHWGVDGDPMPNWKVSFRSTASPAQIRQIFSPAFGDGLVFTAVGNQYNTNQNFIVRDGTGQDVYFGDAFGKRDVIFAFDAATGALVWTQPITSPAPIIGTNNERFTALHGSGELIFEALTKSLYFRFLHKHHGPLQVEVAGETTGAAITLNSYVSTSDTRCSSIIAKLNPATGLADWARTLVQPSIASGRGRRGRMQAASSTEILVFHRKENRMPSTSGRLYSSPTEYTEWPNMGNNFSGILTISSTGDVDTINPNAQGTFFRHPTINRYIDVRNSSTADTNLNFGGGITVSENAGESLSYVTMYEIQVFTSGSPVPFTRRELVPVTGPNPWMKVVGGGSVNPVVNVDTNGQVRALVGIQTTGDHFIGATQITPETVDGQTARDTAICKVDPLTGGVSALQRIYRSDKALNDFPFIPGSGAGTRVAIGPVPGGGAAVVLNLQAGETPTTLSNSANASEITIPTRQGTSPASLEFYQALFTTNEQGDLFDLPDFGFVPPPAPPNPGSPAAPPFVSINWPANALEDFPISATATVANPQVTEPDLPTGDVEFDPNAGNTPPGPVTGLAATAGNTQAFLNWEPVAGATSYRVYLADIIGDVFVSETTAGSYLAGNLVNGTSYTFRVEAVNAAGVSSRASVTVTPVSSGPFNEIGLQWSALRWELWDPVAGQWFTGSREFASDLFGRGTFTLIPHDPAIHTSPGAPDYVAPYTAEVKFDPLQDWFGTVRSLLRVVATRSDGVVLTSAPTALVTIYESVYDRPTTPEGSMPDILENQVSVGNFTTVSPEPGPFTWELSPEVEEPYAVTSTTSITVLRDGIPAGTAAITGGQGTKQAQVSFTPLPNVNGNFSFSIRVGDGGDGEDDGWTSWVTVTVNVGSVTVPPSAPFPNTMPTIDEDDGPAVQLFAVTDTDVDPGGDAPQARWEIAPAPNNNMARRDFITLSSGLVEIIDEDLPGAEDDLEATVRYTPALNFFGSYNFYIRAFKETSQGRFTGPWTKVTGIVNPVDDRPTPPQPRRMPTVELGQVAVGNFTTFDPDGGPWTWEVAPTSAGTWGSSATLAGVGTVAVTGTTTSSTVVYTPNPSFTGGSYSFWLRVTDSTNLTSDPVRVSGAVSVQQPTAFLTLLNRTQNGATLERVGTLPLVDAEITDSVTGPGGASVSVPTDRLRQIAADLSWTVDELLYPGGIELHLAVGPVTVFAGPVTGHLTEPELATTRIDADGLASYLADRGVEGDTAATFVGDRPDEIMSSLLSTAQGLDYGELLIADQTTPVGDPFSTEFEPGTMLAKAFDEVGTRLGGPEWWITADRELRTAAIRGTDRRDSLLLTDGCAELERETDDSTLATVADVDGDDVLGTAAATTQVLARFGRRYVRLAAERLDTQEAANALAAQHVADFGTPVPARRLTHYAQRDGVGAFDYVAGDAIRVESRGPDGVERVGVRVINRTARLVGPNAWVVTSDVEVVADGALRPARSRHLPSLYAALYDAVFR